MTDTIHVEVWHPARERWEPAGPPLTARQDPGSMSDYTAGRQVLVFGWIADTPGVWRTSTGLDVESIIPAGKRTVFAFDGLEELADLRCGPHTRDIATEAGRKIRVRWRLSTQPLAHR